MNEARQKNAKNAGSCGVESEPRDACLNDVLTFKLRIVLPSASSTVTPSESVQNFYEN